MTEGGGIMATIYKYGATLRGFAPGAQPMNNLLTASSDPGRRYFTILEYSSPLSSEDIQRYELELIDIREQFYPFESIS